MASADGETLAVAVAGSERAGSAFEIAVDVSRGATVLDAIRASGALERHPSIDISTATVGIWGRAAALTTVLQGGDRVEIYRPLAVDPKEARRRRALELKESARRKSGSARP